MRHIPKSAITCIVAVFFSFVSQAATSTVLPEASGGFSRMEVINPSPFAGMTIKEFLDLTPRRYKELTGKKMSFSTKLALKITQYRVKRLVKKNKQVDVAVFAAAVVDGSFDIPGFLLGIFLGPLGILIAYLIEGKNSSMFRWALYGAIIWLALFLLVVLIL